jgi:hypothetical protein
MREDRFLQAFADAGLHGIEVVAYQDGPWAVVDGIEFRSVTVVAHKGKQGPCWEHNEAVLYKGPWKEVTDDDGHVLRRGERTAVCRKTFEILTRTPYGESVVGIPPLIPVSAEALRPFECRGTSLRPPSATKLGVVRADVAPGTNACGADGSCC